METAQLGAACVDCHGGDTCNADWARYQSGFDSYQDRDDFGEELQNEVRARVKRFTLWPITWRKVWLVITTGLTVVSAGVFFLSFFDGGRCCTLDCIDKLAAWIRESVSWLRWLLDASTSEVRAASGTVGLGSFTALVGQMDCSRRTYKKITAIFSDAFGDARPIFLGSGQLQFSIGDCGIAVSGGNCEHHFNWAAVETARLVEKGSSTGSLWVCGAKLPSFEFGVAPGKATHLLVHMKLPRTEEQDAKAKRAAEKAVKKLKDKAPLRSKTFLVIPEHFFHAPVDGCVWKEFVRHFHHWKCVEGWSEE